MSVHTEHGNKALATAFLSTLLWCGTSWEQLLSKQVQLMVNHSSFRMITLCLHKITPDFLWLWCMKEKLRSSGESEPEELGPSCSWQDSGSFLCLSRKCTKSDYTVFHLHAYRTGNPVSPCLVGLLVHCLQVSQFVFVCICLKFAQTYSI